MQAWKRQFGQHFSFFLKNSSQVQVMWEWERGVATQEQNASPGEISTNDPVVNMIFDVCCAICTSCSGNTIFEWPLKTQIGFFGPQIDVFLR